MKRLRFKDENGKDYPKPSIKKLGEVWKEDNYKTKSNNEYPIISSTKDDVFLQSEYFKRQIASKDNTGYKILHKGRIVLSPQNAWMGNINLNTKYDIGIVSPSYKIYNLVNAESDYFRFLIKTPKFINRIDNFSEQGASIVRKNLNITELLDSKLYIPTLDEQKKIGGFLSAIDRLVDKQKDKVNLLKEMKGGYLQKIFSQEIRFKNDNGNNYHEWEVKKLKDISIINDGTHYTPKYVETGIPFYSVETVANNVKYKYITLEEHKKLIKRIKPEKGDILLTRIGTMGKTKLVDWEYAFSIYVSLALIKPSNKIDSVYLNQFLKSEKYKKELLSKSLLLATPVKINVKDLKTTKIVYPKLEEQQKIGKFLTSLDKVIHQQDEKYKQYNNIKKAYMQRLFAE